MFNSTLLLNRSLVGLSGGKGHFDLSHHDGIGAKLPHLSRRTVIVCGRLHRGVRPDLSAHRTGDTSVLRIKGGGNEHHRCAACSVTTTSLSSTDVAQQETVVCSEAPSVQELRNLIESVVDGTPHSIVAWPEATQLAERLQSSLAHGLTTDLNGFAERRARYGTNELPEAETVTFWELLSEACEDTTLQLLLASGFISLLLGLSVSESHADWIEGTAILMSVVIVVMVTATTNYHKESKFRQLSSLKKNIRVRVVRDGHESLVSSADLLVGDILVVEAGDILVADGLLVQGGELRVDESFLTGESEDVLKSLGSSTMLLSGSRVLQGFGRMLVLAVGSNSQQGIINSLVLGSHRVGQSEGSLQLPPPTAVAASTGRSHLRETTALMRKLEDLASQIGNFGVWAAGTVLGVNLLLYGWDVVSSGGPLLSWQHAQVCLEFLITSITILVVAVPEGLPLAVTLALAFGVQRLLTEHNLVRRLDACETMGTCTTICSDKTGTLTENRMRVARLWSSGHNFAVRSSQSRARKAARMLGTLSTGSMGSIGSMASGGSIGSTGGTASSSSSGSASEADVDLLVTLAPAGCACAFVPLPEGSTGGTASSDGSTGGTASSDGKGASESLALAVPLPGGGADNATPGWVGAAPTAMNGSSASGKQTLPHSTANGNGRQGELQTAASSEHAPSQSTANGSGKQGDLHPAPTGNHAQPQSTANGSGNQGDLHSAASSEHAQPQSTANGSGKQAALDRTASSDHSPLHSTANGSGKPAAAAGAGAERAAIASASVGAPDVQLPHGGSVVRDPDALRLASGAEVSKSNPDGAGKGGSVVKGLDALRVASGAAASTSSPVGGRNFGSRAKAAEDGRRGGAKAALASRQALPSFMSMSSLSLDEDDNPDAPPLGSGVTLLPPDARELLFLNIGLNSSATILPNTVTGKMDHAGSGTECALLEFAVKLGGSCNALATLREAHPPLQVFPFTSQRKRMTTVVKRSGGMLCVLTKGAAEVVLDFCNRQVCSDGSVVMLPAADKQHLVESFTGEGLRVLALAYRDLPGASPEDGPLAESAAERDLVLLGLVGLEDSLRPGVAEAVGQCTRAGIVVRMLTGDNGVTAAAIARQAGILPSLADCPQLPPGAVMEGPAFRRAVAPGGVLDRAALLAMWPQLRVLARCSPSDKHLLVGSVKKLREEGAWGEVVAVTGDGTNDAPALSCADVGFAMNSGTEIAKEASDILLLNDSFTSIVSAVKWGRNVYSGITRFLQFQLTANVVAVVTACAGALLLRRSPLSAVQMLWVNLIMDSLASLALATEPPKDDVLDTPPCSVQQPLITPRVAKHIIGQSVFQLLAMYTLVAHGQELLGCSEEVARTVAFNTFVMMQLFNQVNCRKVRDEAVIFEGLLESNLFLAILLGELALQVLIVEFGGAAFQTTHLDSTQWAVCVLVGGTSLLVRAVLRVLPVPEHSAQPPAAAPLP